MESFNIKNMSVQEVLEELTLEEKAELVSGGGIYTSKTMKKYGIQPALFIDGGCGVNIRQYLEALYDTGVIADNMETEEKETEGIGTMARFGNIASNIVERNLLNSKDNELLDSFLDYVEKLISVREYPSCFPSNSLLAATWNRDAVYKNACAVGKEASAYGVDVLLGTPCINIQRDPRGGRGFENYSEDPFLTGELAAEFVKGIQDQGIIANVKHFAANNQETDRMHINEIIPERALYEIYFPAFQACIQKGGAKTVMSAYNWINGKACAQNEWLLKDVLRGEWGFDGFVVSDWRASYDFVQAVKAGTDLTMPGPRNPQEILDAIRSGVLSREDLDKAAGNFLNILKQMPALDGRKHTEIPYLLSAETAYETACEGITLLKNEGGALPLKKDSHVAFFGQGASSLIESGIGSGHVFTDKSGNLLERARNIAGNNHITHNRIESDTQSVVLVVSTEGQEGGDCTDICLNFRDLKLLKDILKEAEPKKMKVILVLNTAGPVELGEFIDYIDACVNIYYPGQEGARALADILFGRVNPNGKLPHTFPKKYRDCPSYGNFPGYNEKVFYGEGIYVGYRWYDTRQIEPLFPFGHGLSYTTFEFSDLKLSTSVLDIDKDETLKVSIRIKNTGSMPGKEVVQLYVKDTASTLDKPEKELKGFEKVELNPGESRLLSFTLNKQALSSFDTKMHEWVCEAGEFEVLIGNSSRNILAKAGFRAVGYNPYNYNKDTPIIKISKDERAVHVILSNLKGSITEKEFYNAAYFGQRHSFETVWNTMLVKYVNGTEQEKDKLYQEVLGQLGEIDTSAAKLVEKFVF